MDGCAYPLALLLSHFFSRTSSLALLLSLLTAMSRPGDFDHLCSTEVRLKQPSHSPSPTTTFVLDDKLSEEYQTMT